MGIVKAGEPFVSKFAGREEHKAELKFGALPISYSALRVPRHLDPELKYKLALSLNDDEMEEVRAEVMPLLKELNRLGGFKATDKKLEELLGRILGPSTVEDGRNRFYGSKRMTYMPKDSDELTVTRLDVYNGSISDENLMDNNDRMLGRGSRVRSVFLVALFKDQKGQVLLSVVPQTVVVIEKVELPPMEGRPVTSFDDVSDSDSPYDYT